MKVNIEENDVIGVWYGTHGTPANPYPYTWFPKTVQEYYQSYKCIKTIISDSPPSNSEMEGVWFIQVKAGRLRQYKGIQKALSLARLVIAQLGSHPNQEYIMNELKERARETEEILLT